MRLLQIDSLEGIRKAMQQIKVDGYGIKIMLPKAMHALVRINSIPCITANILKQEMLSLGGEAAVSRDTLTGRDAKTDCLLIGNLAQFSRLTEKLNRQPFALDKLSKSLALALANYQNDSLTLTLGRHKFDFKKRSFIMGIMNLTPDSFSSDGLYRQATGDKNSINDIVRFAQELVRAGADIIDVGGESSRPGARPVTLKEELRRTIPVIKRLSRLIKVPISIDTRKPEVARQALDNGAAIVNDITALKNPLMPGIIRRHKAAVVLMHMKGAPCNMQRNPAYVSVLDEVREYLSKAVERALAAGIEKNKIIVDPGIGFAKTSGHNLEIINNLKELKILGCPILIGTSRKSFIGSTLNLKVQERLLGTVSSCVLAAKNGANILRVHDVAYVSQALRMADAINRAG